jgi:hypothetical protein
VSSVYVAPIMYARAATAPSCSGFTIGQIGVIMCSPAAVIPNTRIAGTSTTEICTPARSHSAPAFRVAKVRGAGFAASIRAQSPVSILPAPRRPSTRRAQTSKPRGAYSYRSGPRPIFRRARSARLDRGEVPPLWPRRANGDRLEAVTQRRWLTVAGRRRLMILSRCHAGAISSR